MVNYIIITPSVYDLGGAQLFTMRRTKHLLKKGYNVYLVIASTSEYYPLEKEFEEIPIIITPEIIRHTTEFSPSKRKKILDSIVGQIKTEGDIQIESHSLILIEWGELLAHHCKGKHLAYPLAELKVSHFHSKLGNRIFSYKLEHGQFYGCSSASLRHIFESDSVPSNYVNIGYDESEMAESCLPALPYNKKDGEFVISTVSRLEKAYIEPFIVNTIEFVKKYPNQKFVLLLAGGSSTPGREEYLISTYGNNAHHLPNLNVIISGYIDRLGKDFFNISDVFVGTGTASINSISQGCLTINTVSIGSDVFCSGFFGTDTNNFAYPDSGKTFSIKDKLEEAFLLDEEARNGIKKRGRDLYNNSFEMTDCFNKLDKVFDTMLPVENKTSFDIAWYDKCYDYLCLRIIKSIKSWM